MAVYPRILLAVDLAADSLALGQPARALADALAAELHIVHVQEPIPPIAPIPPALTNYPRSNRETEGPMD
jgi:nucleotide-binding universal stress UspA family protein